MKNVLMMSLFLAALFVLMLAASKLAGAGEDISVTEDHSGHRIEQVEKHPYGIVSGGLGRLDSENSLVGGLGVGLQLAGDEDLALFGELGLWYQGTYHTGTNNCQPLAVANAGSRHRQHPEQPASQPHGHGSVCDSSLTSEDAVGALAEFKLNLVGNNRVQPFASLGASFGDLKGFVGGLGLQTGPYRIHLRAFNNSGDHLYTFTVSVELF